jgi:hypothetical protein
MQDITGADITAIVFRIEHVRKDKTYSEKNFADLIGIPPRNPNANQVVTKAPWADQFNFDKSPLYWYHDNKKQLSGNSNWATRLFVMRLNGKPTKEQVIAIGEELVALYNRSENIGKTDFLCFNRNQYFWLPDPVVWSDILGQNGACEELLRVTQISGAPDQHFFQQHKKLCRAFFRPKSMSAQVANLLGAPQTEVFTDNATAEISTDISSTVVDHDQNYTEWSFASNYNPSRDVYVNLKVPKKKKKNEENEEESEDNQDEEEESEEDNNGDEEDGDYNEE